MKVISWILQALLAIAFLGAGFSKLSMPHAELMTQEGMAWVGDFSPIQIQIISVLELLGAIGVIIPMFIDKLKRLVPIAAFGLALTMIGAIIVHIGRGESFMIQTVLLLLALGTTYLRKDLLKG